MPGFNHQRNLCQSRTPCGVESGLWPETGDVSAGRSRHSLDATPLAEISQNIPYDRQKAFVNRGNVFVGQLNVFDHQ
jgi:hypothetical protein